MDVKEVAELAKKLIADLFASEGAHSIRLEEIMREREGEWRVTVSFLRAPTESSAAGTISGIASFVAAADRAYKIISIDEARRNIKSVRDKVIQN